MGKKKFRSDLANHELMGLRWLAPIQWPQSRDGEAHVWRASLEQTPAEVERLGQRLSADEMAKAEGRIALGDRAFAAHGSV
ncbi:MAG TPA: hypothetical protein VIM99_06495 [Blastocatellia bacterium]